MPLYLTFDIGTTSLKTAIISQDGRVHAVHTSEYTPVFPQTEWVEMPPERYWQAAIEGTRAVFAKSGLMATDLAAIGFSSQGQTFVPIDHNGQPMYNAIVWVDNRAQAIANEWESSWLSADEFRKISGYPWIPATLTVFKVAWMRKYMPQILKAWKFLFLPDYLIYRITGRTVTDRVIALMSGFYDLQSSNWEPRLLDAAGITPDQLPQILEPGQIGGFVNHTAAHELGIPVGIPVCVGANDQLAGAIGAGNVRTGIVTETTGTSLALMATTDRLVDDKRVCVGRHAVKDLYYILSFTNTSAIVLKWFRDICGSDQSYDEFLKGVEGVTPGSDGLTVIPHFAGTAMPTFNPNARGAFVGLTLGHSRDHISRAIMESCACMLKECLQPVAECGVNINTVRSLGGASKNNLWLQIKSDMLGVQLERPKCTDAASLGAGMLAATGIGAFSSIQEASDTWYKSAKIFTPNKELYPVYEEVYRRYLDIYTKLYGNSA